MTENKKTNPPSEMALASTVSKVVEISNVRLKAFHAVRITDSHFENADIGIHVESETERIDSSIAVEINFALQVQDDAEDLKIASIGCKHVLTYAITCENGSEIEDSCIDAFGKINGLYNCWPYIREIIQTSLSRLDLPSFTMPVMTADRILSVYKSSSETQEESSQ